MALTNPSVPPDEKGEPAPAAATTASTIEIFKRHKDKFELLVPKGAEIAEVIAEMLLRYRRDVSNDVPI